VGRCSVKADPEHLTTWDPRMAWQPRGSGSPPHSGNPMFATWQWQQLGHMQICTLTQTQPCQHPTTQFFTGWMPFLPRNQQHQSSEGILGHNDMQYKTSGLDITERARNALSHLNFVPGGVRSVVIRYVCLSTCSHNWETTRLTFIKFLGMAVAQ